MAINCLTIIHEKEYKIKKGIGLEINKMQERSFPTATESFGASASPVAAIFARTKSVYEVDPWDWGNGWYSNIIFMEME